LSWQAALYVAIGGAIGSVLRYAVTILAAARWGPAVPWGTLIVNVAGSFVIGVVAELATGRGAFLSPGARIFIATGLCGGFTTFSSYSLDALNLARDGAAAPALLYVLGSVVLGLAAVYLGVAAARAVTLSA